MGNLGMELNLENTWKWEDGKVSKFKIGDQVKIVDRGEQYRAYQEWVFRYAPKYYSRFKRENEGDNNDKGEIVAMGNHLSFTGDKLLLLDIGYSMCLINEKGVELVEKSKYKVGDKVRVVSYLNDDLDPEVGVSDSMLRMRGKVVTISEITSRGNYRLEEDDDDWTWTDNMLEPILDNVHYKCPHCGNNSTKEEWEEQEQYSEITFEALVELLREEGNNYKVNVKHECDEVFFLMDEFSYFDDIIRKASGLGTTNLSDLFSKGRWFIQKA